MLPPAGDAAAQTAAQTAPAEAAEGSPEWLIESFFKRKEWPEVRNYYTAEMSRGYGRVPHPGSAYWKPDYVITPREFGRTENTRAIAVAVTMKDGREQTDFYVFLQREAGGWKIARARARTIPPGVLQMTAMTMSSREKPSDAEIWDLQRMKSFQLSDAQLKEYFAKQRTELDELARRLGRAGATGVIHGATRPSGVEKETWQKVRDLGLYYAEVQSKGWIECTLARVGESAVGFLWVHERAEAPVPTEKLTVVEHLDGPWYLYRQIQ
ncbi:MAG TPA: hypothetical protein VGD81_07855 [Opitutaceae bacterium]